jgi:hypothetical protein
MLPETARSGFELDRVVSSLPIKELFSCVFSKLIVSERYRFLELQCRRDEQVKLEGKA